MRSELGVACVDLDSVLLYHHCKDGNSRLGRPLSLGRKLTLWLKKRGWKVVILTARPQYQHPAIWDYLVSRGFEVDDVTNMKPAADAYFDDKAIRVPKNWQ